ncbi:M13 family peptidase [Granulicella sp. 5B5]|uniref:M13 family metallopeptidase n=1 Tax=Granulicella sp. 5B5 TaxID=1617967 RepID=UPI0015F56968|nr:M13 family metallopeptidase [Granulicella sp. 5B5]QMV18242.1 M13 family peptidase [Granulicella sp. 5B5]
MPSHRIALVTTLALTASLAATLAIAQTPGIQPNDIDHAVKPGDDFYLYANGTWLDRTVLPPDRVAIGAFSIVADKTDKQVAAIVDDAAAANAAPGTSKRLIADLYHAYMDESAIEKHGMATLKPQLAAIAAIKDKHELSTALGHSLRADTDALNNTNFHTSNIFGLWVAPGFQDSDHYAPYLMQGGIEMPDRAYYLDDSAHMKSIRDSYSKHVVAVFTIAGLSDPEARAARVIALEHAIAEAHIALADNEDIHKANNLWQTADFATKAPGLDWTEFFHAAGLSTQKTLYVWQPTAITGESALVASQPLDAWKDWLALHLIDDNTSGISKALANEHFAFFGTTLSGAPQQRPRDQRALAVVNSYLGDTVGQLYAERYFPPAARAKAQAMVSNLLAAFHKRLEAIDWMAPSTKAEAIRKLDALYVGVGYADHWRSYAGLEIKPDDLLGDYQRADLFEYHYALSRIGKPVDRHEWCMEPQTVNAVNLPLNNGLNFPAAILQPPFFDASAPDASNYGAIGAVIGHEISHTFDSEGAEFDSKGQVRKWWTDADYAHFKQVTGALAAQFDGYEPYPGVHVNGRQTLGEDIADLGGLAAAYDAFHAAQHGQPIKVVDGFDGDQQFYLAFGQIWRTKIREAAERRQILTDPHAPGHYRAETVRNFDAWYKAFHIQPGEKLYLAPDQRVRIW